MKMLNCVLASLVTLVCASAVDANACTVLPVNATEQKNDLAAKALTNLNVSIENVLAVDVKNYAGDYLWTPMCPRGLTAEAELTISFNDAEDALTKGCTAIVKVSKNFIYEEGAPKYTFDVVQAASCLE